MQAPKTTHLRKNDVSGHTEEVAGAIPAAIFIVGKNTGYLPREVAFQGVDGYGMLVKGVGPLQS